MSFRELLPTSCEGKHSVLAVGLLVYELVEILLGILPRALAVGACHASSLS